MTKRGTCSSCEQPVRVTNADTAYKHGRYTTCVGTGQPVTRDRKPGRSSSSDVTIDVVTAAIDASF